MSLSSEAENGIFYDLAPGCLQVAAGREIDTYWPTQFLGDQQNLLMAFSIFWASTSIAAENSLSLNGERETQEADILQKFFISPTCGCWLVRMNRYWCLRVCRCVDV
jgi:hypothetical protein